MTFNGGLNQSELESYDTNADMRPVFDSFECKCDEWITDIVICLRLVNALLCNLIFLETSI